LEECCASEDRARERESEIERERERERERDQTRTGAEWRFMLKFGGLVWR